MSAVLRMRSVSRTHGEGSLAVHALQDFDLTVAERELVAVMGPSGSGKSTMLQIAGGLDRPTAGRVDVDGIDLTCLDRTGLAAVRRRHVGYVFQELNLVSTLTLAENVALPMELDGTPRRRARTVALEAMTRVEIAELADRFPDDVSGGQRQRAAIARALVGERRLLLADEPTGALDSVNGEAIMRLLRGQADDGAAGVLVTHDARLAAWADRIVFLRDGRHVDTAGPRAEQLLGTT